MCLTFQVYMCTKKKTTTKQIKENLMYEFILLYIIIAKKIFKFFLYVADLYS